MCKNIMKLKKILVFAIFIICLSGCTKGVQQSKDKAQQDNSSKQLFEDDYLSKMDVKEFRKEFAKLPDDYKIKINDVYLFKNFFQDKNGDSITISDEGIVTKGEIKKIKSFNTVTDYGRDKSYKTGSGKLYGPYKGKLSLKGLRYCCNISSVTIYKCNISNLDETNYLDKLETLNVEYIQLKDIGFLKDYSKISSLSFKGNNISDISLLSTMNNCYDLDLEGNQIKDISSLAVNKKDIHYLNLSNNKITNISPLSKILGDNSSMYGLYLSDNEIKDISVLKNLKHIDNCFLHNNEIEDITPLSNLKEVYYMSLAGNPISDISPLKKLKMDPEEDNNIDLSNTKIDKTLAKRMFGKCLEMKKKRTIKYNDEYGGKRDNSQYDEDEW